MTKTHFRGVCLFVLLSTLPLPSMGAVRSYDGRENNLDHLLWGSAGARFVRLADQAYYADDVSAPAGPARPNPRSVSNRVGYQPSSLPDPRCLSDITWQWGQLIDHDIALTPVGDEFFPIMVEDENDSLFPMIPLMRSVFDPTTGTSVDNPRQQVNANTSYIDASMVYGSNADRAAALRTFDQGMLMTSPGNLLPRNNLEYFDEPLENANAGIEPDATLFVAGDIRVNEQVGLIAMHTLLVREHNRLAAELAATHTGWDDEQIYQHARKLVGGIVQNITFSEYLPALLGIDSLLEGAAYDPDADATLSNEFATGVYRMGHTQVSPQLQRIDDTGQAAPGGPVELKDAFFSPSLIDGSQEIDYLLKGLTSQVQQTTDTQVIETLRNSMFGAPGAGGLDLFSLNIQRGRDHGLPSLTQLQEALEWPVAQDFADVTSDPTLRAALASQYATVEEIDLWIGVLSEDPLPGKSVGPTLQWIVADQFEKLMVGDRFFFLWDDELTEADRELITASRLSDVILRNTSLTSLRPNLFFVPEPAGGGALWATLASVLPGVRRRLFGTARRCRHQMVSAS